MKLFNLILLIFLIAGCSKGIAPQFENQMIVTKKYAGKHQYSYFDGKYTTIVTDKDAFKVCGEVDIFDSALCYIRIVPVYVDCSKFVRDQLQRKYFSFNGVEYRVKTW